MPLSVHNSKIQKTYGPVAHLSSEECPFVSFSYSKANGITFDLAIKNGQGQPRVIMYIILVVLESQMLHIIKFQGKQPSGSGEDFIL